MGDNEKETASATVEVGVGRYVCSICFDDGETYDVYMCAEGARAYSAHGDRVGPGLFDGDAFCRCVPGLRDRASERLDVLPEGDTAIDRGVRDLVGGRICELVLSTGAGRADMVLRVEGGMLAARADGDGGPFEDCIGLYERDVSSAVASLLDEECINREGDNNA